MFFTWEIIKTNYKDMLSVFPEKIIAIPNNVN